MRPKTYTGGPVVVKVSSATISDIVSQIARRCHHVRGSSPNVNGSFVADETNVVRFPERRLERLEQLQLLAHHLGEWELAKEILHLAERLAEGIVDLGTAERRIDDISGQLIKLYEEAEGPRAFWGQVLRPPWFGIRAEPGSPKSIFNSAVTMTFFPNQYAQTKKEEKLTFQELADRILSTTKSSKKNLPFVKLGTFSGEINPINLKGRCLRFDKGVVSITGVEGDKDEAPLSFEEAIAKLKAAKLLALLYTSASHAKKKPRFRVLCPTSRALPPTERIKLIKRLNGVLDGALSGESFTLSQSYYFGKVKGAASPLIRIVEGDYIDQRPDLDAGALGKNKKPRKEKAENKKSRKEKAENVLDYYEEYGKENTFKAPIDVEQMLADMEPGHEVNNIHNTQLSVIAALLTRGVSRDEAITRVLKRTMEVTTIPSKKTRATQTKILQGMADSWLRKKPEIVEDPERRAKQIATNIKIGEDIKEEPIHPAVMMLEEMHKRLVYIGVGGVVVDRITGRIRKKDVANTEYAASRYFNKKTGKYVPILQVWLSSPQRVQVDVLAWVPGAAQICSPPEAVEGWKTALNTWKGLSAPKAPKDWKKQAKPFLDHVAFLMPVKSERERFLQWLAHIIQHPEVLPHTYYLMTTRTTGIGRNLLASIITRVLRGHVAAGVSLPELLDGSFTGRLSRKLLSIVDEAREGGGDKRFQRAEALKRIVTQEHREINIKYGTQSVEKNCCRWLMFSNHLDAIPFDNTDRRCIVIENPTERKPAQYYEKLFALLDDRNFIASVWKMLERMDISDFRPGEHAPMNAAKINALESMQSATERAVCDFENDCRTELASREDIRSFVESAQDDNRSINENYLTHAITAAGMVNTGRRIKWKGKWHSVVIVRDGEWTRKIVQKVSSEVLLDATGLRTEVEQIAVDFKKGCKTELASLDTIRIYIEKRSGKKVAERQLKLAISAAGMIIVGNRKVPGTDHAVVVVNSEKWSRETINEAQDQELLAAMRLKMQ